ncbi:MAG: tRNA glutamyl-Q(34) synthetase GluQRS [Gammaproteobacteria bacterium]|nr:tRNA glutamyl-Q(34) synthetase GluQRS [Gammaproteobacteria bacterium]MCP5299639.1 tRNA glutamyl-Q(34) synthetase GluQRS [Chromatiaceae bacterium]
MTESHYRGRFAPSPTGALHFGSLVAAMASFADARSHHGDWLVRIDDVDETRCRHGADAQILRTLQCFGMQWDEPPIRQSERRLRYAEAIDRLVRGGGAFRCSCSRKDVAEAGIEGVEGPIYPGTCRRNPPRAGVKAAWRAAVTDRDIVVLDRVIGGIEQNLAAQVGDFVVMRIDGFTAYQLAVVVDDHDQRITDVVRGADLLWSTPRQYWLQDALGYAHPRYAHVPLVYAGDGNKLSKRDDAFPVNEHDPVASLLAGWRHLGQAAPADRPRSASDFWQWAVPRWRIEQVPKDPRCLHE